jgi:parvulin-like peptidyl-prolyl isomerase
MLRKSFTALMLMFVVFCFMGLAQQSEPGSPAVAQSPGSSTTQGQAPAAASADSNVVVVRVSGEPITEKQVLSAIQALAMQQITLSPDQQKNRSTVLFKGAIDNLVTTTVLKSEAKSQNVTIDKAKVDEQMKSFAARYPSQEEFQKAMADQGFTEAEVRKNVEDSLSMQEVLSLAVKDVPETTEADIQKYYDGNPDKFRLPEQAHLAMISLKTDANSTPEQKAEIRKRLEEIRADIESKKITFADAAIKFSQDTASASKGGDLGFLSRGGKAKALEDTVFATTPGSMTPVFADQAGYRLVQVIEIKPAGTAPLETAKPAIKQFLDQTAKQRAAQKYVEDLRSKAVIQNFMTPEQFEQRHPGQY